MSLKALAADAERIILAMPDEQRQQAFDVIKQTVIVVERSGAAIPPELVRVLLAGIVEAIAKVKFGRSIVALAEQVMAGAPNLLGPHRADVEDFVAHLVKEQAA